MQLVQSHPPQELPPVFYGPNMFKGIGSNMIQYQYHVWWSLLNARDDLVTVDSLNCCTNLDVDTPTWFGDGFLSPQLRICSIVDFDVGPHIAERLIVLRPWPKCCNDYKAHFMSRRRSKSGFCPQISQPMTLEKINGRICRSCSEVPEGCDPRGSPCSLSQASSQRTGDLNLTLVQCRNELIISNGITV